MVSVNSGKNPYIPKQVKTANTPKPTKSSGTRRAPSVPVFPDKKVTKKHITVSNSVTVTSSGNFATKADAYNYVNSSVLNQIKSEIEKQLNQTETAVSLNNKDRVHSDATLPGISQECTSGTAEANDAQNEAQIAIPECDTDHISESDIDGICSEGTACSAGGSNISDINILNYDITSVQVTENEDGTFSVSYTVNYTADVELEIESDWQAGDTYTDENGYTWEYQADGSWVDVTDKSDNNEIISPDKHCYDDDNIAADIYDPKFEWNAKDVLALRYIKF